MEIEIGGFDTVETVIAQLVALPGVLEEVATEDGLLAAAKVVAAEAKANAPVGDGNLRDSIRARRGKRRYRPSALIQAFAPHAHLVEFGTGPRRKKGTGQATGEAPAQPFLEPAAINTKSSQQRAFAEGVKKNFNKVERELKGEIRVRRQTARALAE